MKLTQEQKKIIESNAEITLINAFAGCGKTSTLINFYKQRPQNTFLYLCYNTSMKKEAEKKFTDSNIDVKTFHSLAYSAVGHKFKEKIEKNEKLRASNLKDFFPELGQYDEIELLLKSFTYFINSNLNENEFHKISFNIGGFYTKYLKELWKLVCNENSSIPFEQDFYLKIYEQCNYELNYDYILVDEAQDLNPVMLSLVMKQKAKKVFVGDTYQKIYGFRNCIDALSDLKNLENAESFFLTQTFRCPQNIVDLANQYLFLANSKKKLITQKEKTSETWSETDRYTFIARNNSTIFLFLAENPHLKIHFFGGVKKYNLTDIADIARVFSTNEKSKEKIINPLFKEKLNTKEKLLDFIKENPNEVDISSKLSAFYIAVSKEINIFKVIRSIHHYKENECDVIVTTAHKSKGAEWDRVLLANDLLKVLDEDKIPSEEINLLYVAITRAKSLLKNSEPYDIFSLLSDRPNIKETLEQIKDNIVY